MHISVYIGEFISVKQITYLECEKLLQMADLPEKVRQHCRAVADLAASIAEALCESGHLVDVELCRRGGLLHDICRTEEMHDIKGGNYLEKIGLTQEADITRTHMGRGLISGDNGGVSENEVVYLADKLVRGSQRVSIDERFESAVKKYGIDPEAEAAIAEKHARALHIQDKVEALINKKLSDI
jgi:putative nucleotidyltransferase with HDIG domain